MAWVTSLLASIESRPGAGAVVVVAACVAAAAKNDARRRAGAGEAGGAECALDGRGGTERRGGGRRGRSSGSSARWSGVGDSRRRLGETRDERQETDSRWATLESWSKPPPLGPPPCPKLHPRGTRRRVLALALALPRSSLVARPLPLLQRQPSPPAPPAPCCAVTINHPSVDFKALPDTAGFRRRSCFPQRSLAVPHPRLLRYRYHYRFGPFPHLLPAPIHLDLSASTITSASPQNTRHWQCPCIMLGYNATLPPCSPANCESPEDKKT